MVVVAEAWAPAPCIVAETTRIVAGIVAEATWMQTHAWGIGIGSEASVLAAIVPG